MVGTFFTNHPFTTDYAASNEVSKVQDPSGVGTGGDHFGFVSLRFLYDTVDQTLGNSFAAEFGIHFGMKNPPSVFGLFIIALSDQKILQISGASLCIRFVYDLYTVVIHYGQGTGRTLGDRLPDFVCRCFVDMDPGLAVDVKGFGTSLNTLFGMPAFIGIPEYGNVFGFVQSVHWKYLRWV